MLATIGQLVQSAREAHTMSREVLAARAKVAASAVEALEAGTSGVTTSQLTALADALELDPDALLRGEAVPRPVPSVFLRHHGMQDFYDVDLDLLDGAIEQARALVTLARLLGEEPGLWPLGTFTMSAAPGDAPARQAYGLAQSLRQELVLPTQALSDVRKVLEEQLGIVVLVRRLATPGVEAISVKVPGAAAVILAEAALRHRVPLPRVNLMHEICHVLHDPDTGGVHVVVDLESDARVNRAEQRARAFAAEMLLPFAGLKTVLGEPAAVTGESDARRLVMLAREFFGTPWQIAANHLCNRGFIDQRLRPWLEQLEGPALSKPWTTRLPACGAPSLLVGDRTRRAHEAGLITDGEARSLLSLDVLQPLPWDER